MPTSFEAPLVLPTATDLRPIARDSNKTTDVLDIPVVPPVTVFYLLLGYFNTIEACDLYSEHVMGMIEQHANVQFLVVAD